VAVPGGLVTIEPHLTSDGDVPRANVLPQSTTALGAASVKRDIVVWDESREHQLYRDGPYEWITVNRPLERVIAELNRVGAPTRSRIACTGAALQPLDTHHVQIVLPSCWIPLRSRAHSGKCRRSELVELGEWSPVVLVIAGNGEPKAGVVGSIADVSDVRRLVS
jgi:hypothetical protein